MNIICMENITKYYRVLNRRIGLLGTAMDLFSKNYNTIRAVDGISLDIKEGDIVGFIGPNGAGKSTMIKIMIGVLEPSSGKIVVDNIIPFRNRKEYLKKIGVVFGQRSQLWWELPVIESYNILKEIYQIDTKTYKRNLELFDKLLDLNKFYTVPVRFLSLGQRILCDIAAAFLHNPKIIFLDEPTIGLDVSVKSKVRQIIKELNERNNTTIIITTHDVGDLERLCRNIVIIDKGKIIYNDDINRLRRFFGSYRTLKIHSNLNSVEMHNLEKEINSYFVHKSGFNYQKLDSGWYSITVNEDEVKLLEVLNYLIKEHNIKDVKIEEVEIETIIKNIYEKK